MDDINGSIYFAMCCTRQILIDKQYKMAIYAKGNLLEEYLGHTEGRVEDQAWD